MKKIISYSLFGDDLKYYVGAEKNLELNKQLLPEWETRIYYRQDNIKNGYIDKLQNLGGKLIEVSDIKIGHRPSTDFPYFWRFLAFMENAITLSRDLDSRVSVREAEYINQWLSSENTYFIIRDHPWHSPVPSGLFGIKGRINSFINHMNDYIQTNELVWGTDQDILYQYMQQINTEQIYYCGFDKLETYIPRDNLDFFIGMQLDEFDNPTNPSGIACLKHLKEIGF